MTWGVDPSLAHVAPGTLEFFYNTSTPNDRFAGFAPGYAYPSYMTEDQRWLYAEAAGETMNAAGISVAYLIDFNFSSEFYGPLLHQFQVDALFGLITRLLSIAEPQWLSSVGGSKAGDLCQGVVVAGTLDSSQCSLSHQRAGEG